MRTRFLSCTPFNRLSLLVSLIAFLVPCIEADCNYVISKQDDVTFNSSRKVIHQTKGLQQCLKECSALSTCLSVNFDRSTLQCTINTESVTSTNGHTDVAPGVIYLERNQWEQTIAGPCENTACPTHSKCIALRSGQTTCVVFECPDPTTYYNAYVTTSGVSTDIWSTIQYACANGYYWVGGNVTCTPAGIWQGEDQIEGCLALASGSDCNDDSSCSHITSAECRSGKCVCPTGYAYLSETSICSKDCKSLFLAGNTTNGVYEITPDGTNSVNTFCDMDNGGWTLFERRSIGDVDFQRNWEAYRFFFGSAGGDFWIGLEFLHDLTVADSDIYFDFTIKTENQPFFARYHNFSVADNNTFFKLSMSSDFEITDAYTNIRNGGFYDHNSMYFSTQDKDNDISSTDCASSRGAWWWNKCYTFGLFLKSFNDMRMFMGFNNTYVYFKDTIMKVKRTK
ncbi:uncharacterized protein LOC117340974 [Pecten maximus]|uniref:uncharacterized protein LOC117340974 n=1 Tax=Pecten maximus TaxID=6579 RepID=UPI0014587F03|nr:uncharacterized protein LOC117340974 [Pecten maximus]